MATERVTPNTVSVGGLKPQASPVDTMIHLSKDVDLTKEKNLLATAEGIAKFGKGMMDIQPVLEEQALSAANKLYRDNENIVDQNKREWKEISDKGLARFNPYTKDYYTKLMSDEVVNAKWAKFLKDNPKFEYDTPEVADAKLKEFKADIMQTLNDRGYAPRHIEEALNKTAALASNKSLDYYNKYAQVEYERGSKAYSNALSNKIINTTFDETTTLDSVINAEAQIARDNGFTKEDTAKAIEDSLKRTIKFKMMNDPTFTTKNRADYMAALDNLTIDGVSIKDISPDLKQNISDHFDQVQAEVWALENRQFTQYENRQKMTAVTVMSELGEAIQQNPNDTEGIIKLANTRISELGLHGEAQMMVLSFINGLKKQTHDVASGYSDPNLLKQITAKIYTDPTMEMTDLLQYQGQLSDEDFGRMFAHLNEKNKGRRAEIINITNEHYDSTKKEAQAWAIKNIPDKENRNAFTKYIDSKLNDMVVNVKESERVGEAGEEFKKLTKELRSDYRKCYEAWKEADQHEKLITNAKPPRYVNRVNETSSFIFWKTGRPYYTTEVRKGYKAGEVPAQGTPYNPKVTTEFAEQRKGYKHQGIDVATNVGDLCVNPLKVNATVKAKGWDAGRNGQGGYGNYVILDLGKGYTLTFGHLDNIPADLTVGMSIQPNGFLGFTGNSGKSTGPHTDLSFRHDNYPVDPDTDPYILSLRGIKK